MPNTTYMPTDDGGKAELLEHLTATLPKYSQLLEINELDLLTLKNDAISFRYTLNALYYVQSYAQQWTNYKNIIRDSRSGNSDWPPLPKLEEPIPPAVSPGIVHRLSGLVNRIKAHKNYTQAQGQDLWIIGAAHPFDPSSWKPTLSSQSDGGHPVIGWTKGQASALEIWVDRNDGKNFVLLNVSTAPNTVDTTPLPEAGTSTLWKYKAIYRLHDQQVGQWSDVLIVIVGG